MGVQGIQQQEGKKGQEAENFDVWMGEQVFWLQRTVDFMKGSVKK